jgi:hypothetical protein
MNPGEIAAILRSPLEYAQLTYQRLPRKSSQWFRDALGGLPGLY